MFRDRQDAARRLASRLEAYKGLPKAVILAIPRGGVAVGRVLAQELDLPLDVILTKKIGHPANAEYAIGAVSLGGAVVDEELLRREGIPEGYVRGEVRRLREVLRERDLLFRGGRGPRSLAGLTVIVTDDGAATGDTALAAVDLVRREGPARIVVALPAASTRAVAALAAKADEVVCLEAREDFLAIGEFYDDFRAVEDEEVLRLLAPAPRRAQKS